MNEKPWRWSICGWTCSKERWSYDCPLLEKNATILGHNACIHVDLEEGGPIYINDSFIERADKCEFLVREEVLGGLKMSFKNRGSEGKANNV